MNWPRFGSGVLMIYLVFVIALAFVRGSFSEALLETTIGLLLAVVLGGGVWLIMGARE